MNKKQFNFENLKEIIEQLRAPLGCPWDREQTHESLKPCMIEEAAEVLAAIRIFKATGDDSNLCEELGDVLLQVMLHSQIAKEEGRFTVEDVIQGISEKMIRRHPHVFSDVQAENSGQALKNWEEIKKQEKEGKPKLESELSEIPKEFPALLRSQKVLQKIKSREKKEESIEESIEIAEKIFQELKLKMGKSTHEEKKLQIGQILNEIVCVSNQLKIHAEQALADYTEDVIIAYDMEN